MDAEIRATLKHAPGWKQRREQSLLLQIAKIDLNYNYNYLHPNIKNSHSQVFCVFKYFTKFTRKQLCKSLDLIWIIFSYLIPFLNLSIHLYAGKGIEQVAVRIL